MNALEFGTLIEYVRLHKCTCTKIPYIQMYVPQLSAGISCVFV